MHFWTKYALSFFAFFFLAVHKWHFLPKISAYFFENSAYFGPKVHTLGPKVHSPFYLFFYILFLYKEKRY